MSDIALREVTKVWETERAEQVRALSMVDLSVPQNEFVAVIGPSGCGKTTLLNIIAGLETPTSGEVSVGGEEVQGPGRDRGVVFQQDAIFMWRTVRKNVEYGLEVQGLAKPERREIADRFLDLVGLREFGNLYPKELSGGMKKRCQIATVLANDPGALLMDEPFGALDYATKCQLQVELGRILATRPKTTLFVTHDVEEAVFLADRVVVMGEGEIAHIVDVPFPRPRPNDLRMSSEFSKAKAALWNMLQHSTPAEAV